MRGAITYMHGWIYKEEYGYTNAFEAYVAQTFSDFPLHYNAGRDRVWGAEHKGKIIGCIGVGGHEEKAPLRWFLLHPHYRGLGWEKDC